MGYQILTIGREFGSGGHEIGEKLAHRTELAFFDNKIIDLALEYGGIEEERLKAADEKKPNSFHYKILENGNSKTGFDLPVEDAMVKLESDMIKQLGEKGNCIIVGRLADQILGEKKECLSIFIHCDMEKRIQRIMERHQVGEKEAASLIKKTDKKRSAYYNNYTHQKWGDPEYYDLVLNSGRLGIEGCVDIIEAIYRKNILARTPWL